MSTTSERFTLRQLPLPAKLVLTVFLLSVGLGYFSALIQLHFQQATPGEFMPTPKNVIRSYHGDEPVLPLVAILESDDALWPKSMRNAFFQKSEDWQEEKEAKGEPVLRKEREAERQLVLGWLRAKAPKDAYDNDAFPIGEKSTGLTEKFKVEKMGKIRSILNARCVVCHGSGGEKAELPFDKFESIDILMHPEPAGRLSARRLAQSTHAHLLSFSMLFALTGLVFAFTSFPVWFRCIVAPMVLVAQVIDVGSWWLARIDGPVGENFARSILFTGGVVATGLMMHIVLSIFNMYGTRGRVILAFMFLGAGAAAFVGKTYFLDPYLEEEKKALIQAVEK